VSWRHPDLPAWRVTLSASSNLMQGQAMKLDGGPTVRRKHTAGMTRPDGSEQLDSERYLALVRHFAGERHSAGREVKHAPSTEYVGFEPERPAGRRGRRPWVFNVSEGDGSMPPVQ
jgi:hypothetical protein